MPSQTQDTFNVAKEAKHAAHEALSEREAQGLERNGPLEQTAARSVEGTARKFYAEERKDEDKNFRGPQSNETEGGDARNPC